MIHKENQFSQAGRWAFIVMAAVLLSGCASTVAKRTQERPAAYAALSPEWKNEVDQGHVKAGMNMDAVFIAWGKPHQVSHGGKGTEEHVTWEYLTQRLEEVYVTGARGGSRWVAVPQTYIMKRVEFVGGVVKEWEDASLAPR